MGDFHLFLVILPIVVFTLGACAAIVKAAARPGSLQPSSFSGRRLRPDYFSPAFTHASLNAACFMLLPPRTA